MSTISKSYYAARGDSELYGMNRELEELILRREDYLDFEASRMNDGLVITLVYQETRELRLDFSSIGGGAWFQQGTLPTNISLGFNSAIGEPIADGQFRWIDNSGSEDVLSADITIEEEGRFITFPLPTTLGNYTGSLTLVGTELVDVNGYGMKEPLSVSMTITGEDEKLPQQGNEPYSRALHSGRLQVSRVVATRGNRVDDLVQQYMVSQELEQEQVLKMLQNRGPEGSTEVLILWWKGTSPRVNRVAPANQSTMSVDTLPQQVFLEFDQPVPVHLLTGGDGDDRLLFDGSRYQDQGMNLVKIDDRGTQFLLQNLPLTSSSVGNHTLLVRSLPNQYGDLPSPPMMFSWQILDVVAISQGAAPASDWICEALPDGDGIETVFYLSQAPIGCPTQVFMNGMLQVPDCYTLVGNQLTFLTPPFAGAGLWVYYKA